MTEPKHYCHAVGCTKEVPRKLLMCIDHWRRVPKKLQQEVWRWYRRGQEEDMNPSQEYLTAAKNAINAVAEKEGKKAGG